MMNHFRSYIVPVALMALFGVQALSAPAKTEDFTFKIPASKIPLNIENQPIAIVASGVVSVRTRGHDDYLLKLEMKADLSDLQQNLTALLRSQLDKDDRCGDRIAIQNASLTPVEPSIRAAVQLHYERYVCLKVFGKQKVQRVVQGNGAIQLKLTPTVEERKTLRLTPAVESIQADGSLGELLRSGSLGAKLREKITDALLSAMRKGTDRNLTLPPAVQDIAAIDEAAFRDNGSGGLALVLGGEVRISEQQIQLVKNQLKERLRAQ